MIGKGHRTTTEGSPDAGSPRRVPAVILAAIADRAERLRRGALVDDRLRARGAVRRPSDHRRVTTPTTEESEQ